MARTVSANFIAALAKKEILPVYLLDIHDSPVIRLCSLPHDLSTSFGDYIGATLQQLESFGEDNLLQNQSMRFAVSGNDAQWLSEALQGNMIGLSCDLYFGILGAGSGAGFVGTGGSLYENERIWMFSGVIDSSDILDDADNSRIIFIVENFLYRLQQSNGARHTDGYQRIADSLDMSHAAVGTLSLKDIGVKGV